MIEEGLCRNYINAQIGKVKRMFKWGASKELIPGSVFHNLATVEGLKRGRSEARETERVKPVPEAHVDAVKDHVSRQVWAMIQLQLHTGARGGELVLMRSIDLDTSGDIWLYRRVEHKTAHHGRERTIYLGPHARQIVREFMADRPVDAYLFNPVQAEQERHAKCTTYRHQPVEPARTARKVGDH